MPKQSKYIFVLGSVISGLGKGILISTIGKILQIYGKKVSVVKIDPYLNIDAGTMNPMEHGETFVTEDGGELDPDFGHYERFLEIPMSKKQNITTGQIYYSVITKERKGEYLGKTVQVVPHIINEIIDRLNELDQLQQPDVMLIEIGGTIGDIESQPFLEAARQIVWERPKEDVSIILLTYVPYPAHIKEAKTKPTQHAVRELRASGLTPNIIICRSEKEIGEKAREKIAFFCEVPKNAVIELPDLDSVFNAPKFIASQGFDNLLSNLLNLDLKNPNWAHLDELISKLQSIDKKIVIGIPGKYTDLVDSYISVNEALKHAGIKFGYDVKLRHLSTEAFEENPENVDVLGEVDGILVPGGFGDRGTEGKILAIKYARENDIPFLGICLGFQLAVVEFARHKIGLKDAHSTEMNPNTKYPIIDLQEEQKHIDQMGGSMRLGNYPIELKEDTMIYNLYQTKIINERHRHRYEINPKFIKLLEENGMRITGFYNELAESMEITGHTFFMGTQFHPEFKSTPWTPSPPYVGLIQAAIERAKKRTG